MDLYKLTVIRLLIIIAKGVCQSYKDETKLKDIEKRWSDWLI